MKWNNQLQITIHTDQLEATKVAHTLIEAGIEASIVPLWAVMVPKDKDSAAHAALYLELERRSKRER